MKVGSGRVAQVVFMAIVSALLGYAFFMAGQASLGYGFSQELDRVVTEQRELVTALQQINRSPAGGVSRNDRERVLNTLKGVVGRQKALSAEIDRTYRLAVWPGVAVGVGYFAMCMITYFRALKRRREAALFLSPAAIAGAREVLEGPFDVQEGRVRLTRQFGGADYDSLAAMQLVAKAVLEGGHDEIVLDVSAETQPFSHFIGVLVSFGIECSQSKKKLKIICAPEALKPLEMVGLNSFATLEVAGTESGSGSGEA